MRENLLSAFAGGIDFTALDDEQFVRLLETLHMLDSAGAGFELRELSTEVLVDIVASASREQLDALAGHPWLRAVFLDEIFERMSRHLRADKAANADLVVSWRFTEGDGAGGYDRYQTVIEDGRCVSGRDLDRSADTTLTLGVSDFIRIATGEVNAASMFVTGRVRVKGDYTPAVRLSGYFDIPKPGRP